jgi:hypothetical protein
MHIKETCKPGKKHEFKFAAIRSFGKVVDDAEVELGKWHAHQRCWQIAIDSAESIIFNR